MRAVRCKRNASDWSWPQADRVGGVRKQLFLRLQGARKLASYQEILTLDWGGIAATALLCLPLGVLLYIPARWWAKRKLANSPAHSQARLRVTPAGRAFATLVVGLLFIGFSQQYFAPQSEFGQFVSTSLGRLVFAIGVTGLSVVIGMVLELVGFTLFRPPSDDGER
jgi:hypothetical protein